MAPWCITQTDMDERPRPKFCGQCGAELPPSLPRFCIECGLPTRLGPPEAEPERSTAFIGGTVKLPSVGALPPGLWWQEQPPGPSDTVQLYMPLRAVVDGWSGLVGRGWQRAGEPPSQVSGVRRFHFESDREWFAAEGFGGGLRLRVRVRAEADSSDGRQRQGFRYRIGHDQPMEVVSAGWRDAHGQPVNQPLPQIQLMAPPRIMRASDYRDERIAELPLARAEAWAREGQVDQPLMLTNPAQAQTPAGRGLLLAPPEPPSLLGRIFGRADYEARLREYRYRVRLLNPLRIAWPAWLELRPRIEQEAQGYGLDLGTEAMVEWWFERQGYDGAVFEPYPSTGHTAVVAFRRAQIAHISTP